MLKIRALKIDQFIVVINSSYLFKISLGKPGLQLLYKILRLYSRDEFPAI